MNIEDFIDKEIAKIANKYNVYATRFENRCNPKITFIEEREICNPDVTIVKLTTQLRCPFFKVMWTTTGKSTLRDGDKYDKKIGLSLARNRAECKAHAKAIKILREVNTILTKLSDNVLESIQKMQSARYNEVADLVFTRATGELRNI